MFRNPSINILSYDVARLASFYVRLGFHESFRTPMGGVPAYVEVTLDSFTIGLRSAEAAVADHGLKPDLGGRSVHIVLWTDNVESDYTRLTVEGVPSLSPPHDYASNLRLAWVADPDGNPIQLVQHR